MDTQEILSWLLSGDISIVFQTRRDLVPGTDSGVLEGLQRRIAAEGWGSRLLAMRNGNGHWGRGYYGPKWTCTHYVLLELQGLGVHPETPECRESITLLLEAPEGSDGGINYARTVPESDVCVNGMILGLASWFRPEHPRIERLVDFLLRVQMPDGGWNCRYLSGDTHSSMHSTISCLEGLSGYLRAGCSRGESGVEEAVLRGCGFLLDHRLFRSHRTGRIIDPAFLKFCYPPRWRYDILRALDLFRAAGYPYDNRMDDALEVLLGKRRSDGTWPNQSGNPGAVYFTMEAAGQPSRWNTLRVLRVLHWAGRHQLDAADPER